MRGRSVKKSHSGLSIAAFVFSLTAVLSLVGIALAVVDLVKKNPEKRHVFSYIAIGIGSLFSVFFFASCISNNSNGSTNIQDTPVTVSSKPIERGIVDSPIIDDDTIELPQEGLDPILDKDGLPANAETEQITTAPINSPNEKTTAKPAEKPTAAPTARLTERPTAAPTAKLTEKPTAAPTEKPTEKPTAAPTAKLTERPTAAPTMNPTDVPKPTEDNQNKKNYVLNTGTMKFHYPSCRDVAKISDGNRSDFYGTREDIIARGFSPCGHCHP